MTMIIRIIITVAVVISKKKEIHKEEGAGEGKKKNVEREEKEGRPMMI